MVFYHYALIVQFDFPLPIILRLHCQVSIRAIVRIVFYLGI